MPVFRCGSESPRREETEGFTLGTGLRSVNIPTQKYNERVRLTISAIKTTISSGISGGAMKSVPSASGTLTFSGQL